MAKKPAKGKSGAAVEKKVNKSKAIRDYMAEHPKAGPSEVSDALTKKGTPVTAAFVSTVKSMAKGKKKGKGKRRTPDAKGVASGTSKWQQWIPVRVRAMVKAGEALFIAGPPDVLDANDPLAAFEGRKGAVLQAVSVEDGKKLAELQLKTPPVFDGMIAAQGCLFLSLEDGSLICLSGVK